MSTTGASFAAKTMYFEKYDKTVKFEVNFGKITIIVIQIWDTAGQEKYRTLTKIFYKDAAVAILVYDITRKGSFDEIKNYWYAQLKEHAPKKLSKILYANNFQSSPLLLIKPIYTKQNKLAKKAEEDMLKKQELYLN